MQPKVSVAEAIRVVQLHGSKKQQAVIPGSLAERAESMSEDEVQALRERIFQKVRRLTDRFRREKIEGSWTLDEEHDQIIPPGWVRA